MMQFQTLFDVTSLWNLGHVWATQFFPLNYVRYSISDKTRRLTFWSRET